MPNSDTPAHAGIRPPVHTPSELSAAMEELEDGTGPIAIDTERAGSYRSDDRVFLLQMRREGTGIILIAPEGMRDDVTRRCQSLLNSTEWIVHAGAADLPPLYELGFSPRTLFDTELAGRFLNHDRTNLAATVELYTGTHLPKGHSTENWSRWPLPRSWLRYAADDVAYLHEVRNYQLDELTAAGKLTWFAEECAHIRTIHRRESMLPAWHELKGINTLDSPRQRAIVQALFDARRTVAQRFDIAEFRVARPTSLLTLAQNGQGADGTVTRVLAGQWKRYRIAPRVRTATIHEFNRAIMQAAALPAHHLPTIPPHTRHTSLNRVERSRFHEMRHRLRHALDDVASDASISPSIIIDADALSAIAVAAIRNRLSEEEVDHLLDDNNVREWQQDLCWEPIYDVVDAHP